MVNSLYPALFNRLPRSWAEANGDMCTPNPYKHNHEYLKTLYPSRICNCLRTVYTIKTKNAKAGRWSIQM